MALRWNRSRQQWETLPQGVLALAAEEHLRSAAPELLKLAKAYEEWEGRVLMEDRAWQTEDGLPHLTQELWDELGQLQAQRNEAIAKAEGDS